MESGNQAEVIRTFYNLGIVTENRDDPDALERMVFSMFDICKVPGYCSNPFAKVGLLCSRRRGALAPAQSLC
jgi:hypothetical protein